MIFGNQVSENVYLPEVEKVVPQKVVPFLAKGSAIFKRPEIDKVTGKVLKKCSVKEKN